MKKYLVVTNIWGKKEVTMWLSRDVFEEEREYFDTIEEAKDFAWLFKEYASVFPNPKKKEISYYDKKFLSASSKNKATYDAFKPGERLWGYVIADTEKCTVLEWGGLCMYNIYKKMDVRIIKDNLFRGEDEIPKDYKWDDGEYEGWLQFRWGDGKNAVGYVEPEKPKKIKDEGDEEQYEGDFFDENDEIENSFLKEEDREKLKRLVDRW